MIGSNYSLIQFFVFSVVGILFFAISLLVGLLLYNIQLSNKTKAYFVNSFLGFFTLIALYSFVVVGIKTINVLSFTALVFLFFKNRTKFSWKDFDTKTILPLLYIFPIIYIIYGCYVLPKSIENDVRYYAKIAYALSEFKQENVYHFFNVQNAQLNGIMPYHYTELWLASLFNVLLGVKSIIALKYISYPFFISCISFGILGFVQKQKFLFFILFVLLSSFPFHLVSVFKTGFIVYTDFWLRPNFIIYYYCLTPIFFFVFEEKWELLFIISIITISTSVIAVPSVLGGLVTLSILLWYKKEISFKQIQYFNLLLFLALVFMAIMYKVFSPDINLFANHSFVQIFMSSISLWKAVIYIFMALCAETFFLLLLSFLLNKFSVNKTKNITLYIGSQIIVGIGAFQFLNQLDNSYQFSYFAYSATGFILIIMMLIFIDNISNTFSKFAIETIIGLICIYYFKPFLNFNSLNQNIEETNLLNNQINKKWIAQVNTYITQHPKAKGGFVLSKKDLVDVAPKSREYIVSQTGNFICYLTDNCNLQSLTCIDTLFFDKTEKNKKDFEKVEATIPLFPKYGNQCNVSAYLNNEFDYFICTENKIIEDTTNLSVIQNIQSKYKFVYKK